MPGYCLRSENRGEPCASNADCPGSSCERRCTFFAGPPNPLAALTGSFCGLTEVAAVFTGSVEVESGTVALDVPLQTKVFDGCPLCEGDSIQNDDVADGLCASGLRAGMPCDAHGTGLYGSTSFDCPPNTAIFSVATSNVPLATATSTWTLSAENRTCLGQTSKRCFCSTCNTWPLEACAVNADCPESGGQPGICGGRRCVGPTNTGAPCTQQSECQPDGACARPGQGTVPNRCLDDTVTPEDESLCADTPPIGDDRGECLFGGLIQRCAPPDLASCLNDSECPLSGTCLVAAPQCYLDSGEIGGSVSAPAQASPPVENVSEPTTLGALFCVPPNDEGAPAIDTAVGLPGLGRYRLQGKLTFADEVMIAASAATDTVSTDTGEADGATADDETETAVTAAVAGEVKIVENAPVGTPPPGGTLVGDQVEVGAPAGTASNPLTLVFNLDGAAAPGRLPNDVDLRRDGVVVPPCLDLPPLPINPDPCVFGRALDGDDIEIGTYSSHGSTWDVVAYGAALPTQTPEVTATPTTTPTPEVSTTPTTTPTPEVSITPTPTPDETATASPAATTTVTPIPTATATVVLPCPPVPGACRAPAVPGKAQLVLVDKAKDKDDQVQWKWLKGAATTKAEFGDPLGADGYALCLYDGTHLIATLTAPAGDLCGKKPCWKAKKTGFVYADGDRTPDGVTQILLKEGPTAGKAQIVVKGKGVNLPMPSLTALTSPLTVQMRRSGGAPCWGSVFSFPPVKKNDGVTFKDIAD